MTIPMRLKKIRYKVAGKYAYEGDLIITHGVVYYFPHTDLIQQRINRASSAVGTIVTGGIGGALGGLGG